MNKDIFVQLLGQRQFKAVRSILDVMNEVDIASLLSELDDKELALAFRLIPKDKAAEVFANMETSMQTYLVDMFSEKELKELLDDLYMDDTVDLLEELPANLVNRILDTVSPSDRTLINQLLNYPEDSAGSIMTTEYVDIRQSMTVAQSMAHIKETGIHKETIYTCYVTDKRKLIGIVSAKDLMTTDDGILISELMETEIISVRTIPIKKKWLNYSENTTCLRFRYLIKTDLWSESSHLTTLWTLWLKKQQKISLRWPPLIQAKKLILIHPLSPTQKTGSHGFSSLCLLPLSQVRSSQNMKTHLLRSRFLYPLSLC